MSLRVFLTKSRTSAIIKLIEPKRPRKPARIAVGRRGTSPVLAYSAITGMPNAKEIIQNKSAMSE